MKVNHGELVINGNVIRKPKSQPNPYLGHKISHTKYGREHKIGKPKGQGCGCGNNPKKKDEKILAN